MQQELTSPGFRSWLGHVSLDTTNHYAQANLEANGKRLNASKPRRPWMQDKTVLAWLDTR